MGFLSSIYLWLIPLSTLPVLIHLFYNKQFRMVEFSTIKFLKDLEIDSMRRVRIIEILLLIIRTLIILFIILMISRPILKSNSFNSYFNSTKPISCVIAIDDSFSVTRSNELPYIRDLFSKKIKAIISSLQNKSMVKIVKYFCS